jgi:hypothetical protein
MTGRAGDWARWVIVLVLVLVVIGLIAYARGPKHHRGDDVGALRAGVAAAGPAHREVSDG